MSSSFLQVFAKHSNCLSNSTIKYHYKYHYHFKIYRVPECLSIFTSISKLGLKIRRYLVRHSIPSLVLKFADGSISERPATRFAHVAVLVDQSGLASRRNGESRGSYRRRGLQPVHSGSRVCCAFASFLPLLWWLPSRHRSSRVFIRVSDVLEVGRATFSSTFHLVRPLSFSLSLSLPLPFLLVAEVIEGQRVRSTCATHTTRLRFRSSAGFRIERRRHVQHTASLPRRFAASHHRYVSMEGKFAFLITSGIFTRVHVRRFFGFIRFERGQLRS